MSALEHSTLLVTSMAPAPPAPCVPTGWTAPVHGSTKHTGRHALYEGSKYPGDNSYAITEAESAGDLGFIAVPGTVPVNHVPLTPVRMPAAMRCGHNAPAAMAALR